VRELLRNDPGGAEQGGLERREGFKAGDISEVIGEDEERDVEERSGGGESLSEEDEAEEAASEKVIVEVERASVVGFSGHAPQVHNHTGNLLRLTYRVE